MKKSSLTRQSLLLCFFAGISCTTFADTAIENFKPAYNVQGLDTQFIDIPPEKKVTSVELNLLGIKDSVVSYRERHPEDLFEIICVTKKPFFGKVQHSLTCINEMKELGEKHTFDGKNFGNYMDEPTVVNVKPGFKVTKINFDVDVGRQPTFEVDKMLESDFPETYTLVRLDPQTNAWNGSRQFVVKEGSNPKE